MCLISVSPKETEKYSDKFLNSIRNGASTNKNGHGFAAKYNNSDIVFYEKGFKDIEELITRIKELGLSKEDELIVHSRTSNRGTICDENTHPFVISDKQDEILDLVGTTINPVLFHNGTFYKYTEPGSKFSDTYHFVKQFMCIPEFVNLLKRDPNLFTQIFKDYFIYTNKLAFMFSDRNIVCIGDFTEDEGYRFSNKGYKDTTYEDIGGAGRYNYSKAKEPAIYPNRNIKLLESTKNKHFSKDQLNIFDENNPYGIPFNDNTKDEIYFERENTFTKEIDYFMIDPKRRISESEGIIWLYIVSLDVIEGREEFLKSGTVRSGESFLYNELEMLRILPRPIYKSKYADYAILQVSGFNESKNQMKKLAKHYSKSSYKMNSTIKLKGLKDPVERSAINLFLKTFSHVLNVKRKKELIIVDKEDIVRYGDILEEMDSITD